jgi:hypothetical protein
MINDLLLEHEFVKVFGKVEIKIPKDAGISLSNIRGFSSGSPMLVSILGAKVFGACIKYDQPIFLILPGDGIKATDCDWDKVDGVMEWSVSRDTTILALSPLVGEAAEILSISTEIETLAECISVTIENGKACLEVPVVGKQCLNVPEWVPNGTVAEACIDACKSGWGRFKVITGAKVFIKVAGVTVTEQKFGKC